MSFVLSKTSSVIPIGGIATLTGNSGGAISPTAGNINIVGSGGVTVAGAGSTLTITGDGLGVQTITGDTGGALSGSNITLTGSTTGLVFNGAGTTETLAGTLIVGNGGTGVATMTTAYAPVCAGTTATGALQVADTGLATAGSVLTSTGAGSLPTWQANSNFAWNEVVGVSDNMAVNNGYIANNLALVTLTLPAVAAVGDVVRVAGKESGLWSIAQNAGQTIHFISPASDTTTGVGGSLSAISQYDSVELLCITANTDFVVLSVVGNLTIV